MWYKYTDNSSLSPFLLLQYHTLGKKATIHQVTTLLATSKNVLFPGHNHLITTGAHGLTLWLSLKSQHCGYLEDSCFFA